ncbi:MAG TPA: IS110 family transposase [Thermoanaerobaculia bacterium]|nr:IS110 family transposase [Thermoanaerobaculia bacterium]
MWTLYVAFELGWRNWKLAFTTGLGQRVAEVSVAARDLGQLRGAIERIRKQFGLPQGCRIISCYEAGRDSFWLHRLLKSWGIENLVVDSSSIEVNRRARRVKTDVLDARKLLSMLVRYKLGERKVWSVVRVPSAAEEDSRHLHRELRTLTKEQTRLINRIKGLLASQGTSIEAGKSSLLERLETTCIWDGSPLPCGLKARLRREIERYEFVHRQVLDLEAQLKMMLSRGTGAALAGIRRLMALRGVGRTTATIFVREFGWRRFRNRRQIGALAGLTPTPFQSGDSSRETGISRAGNRHVRGIAIDLAWGWLRLQPRSELSRWYFRRFAGGGARIRKIGIVALARRLLIELWRYLAVGTLPTGARLKSATL